MSLEARLQECSARGAEGICSLVDEIIAEGLRQRASDIHIGPAADRVLVRFRLDGVLHPPIAVRTDVPQNVVARLKVLANLLTYQTDVPQEGRIDRDKVGAPTDLRVSTFPAVGGERVVVRLFDPATQEVRLGELGYPEAVRLELERQLQMPKGVLLLTGPAGSGKTTTIYAALRYVLASSGGTQNIVTVEDPVESLLPGVVQTEVRPAAGLTFARCLRSLMRQDPEVVVVGEIRDRETADIAVEAGLTGHLVMSTIHSGTATGVFIRLLEMGVEPYLITSAVNFVVAQRLIRRLCPRCKAPVGEAEGLLGLPADLLGSARQPRGCEACFRTGYAGRVPIVECLKMSETLRKGIVARVSGEELQRVAVQGGMRTLTDSALDVVGAGVSSPSEVRRVLGPDALRDGSE